MSTILDALSRAERERRMGQAPAIAHALLDHPGPTAAAATGADRRWMLAAAAGLLCAGVIGVLVFTLGKPHASDARAPVQAERAIARPASGLQIAPAPMAASTSASAKPSAPREQTIAAAKLPDVSPSEGKAKAPSLPSSNASKPAPRPTSARALAPVQPSAPAPAQQSASSQVLASAPASASASTQPSAQANTPPLPWFQDLPLATRQELPPITLGGYIYAAQAAERSILINGKLLREGDQLHPGLRLEQMRKDGVVFAYKDLRFRMAY